MEKLVAVKDDPRYDLIVLDTPPTANALDFLDAPERLMEALDSATMKWFVAGVPDRRQVLAQPPREERGGRPPRRSARSPAAASSRRWRSSSRELNDLFGGFKERAKRVQKTLRSRADVAFVLVTSAVAAEHPGGRSTSRSASTSTRCRATRSS